MVFSTWENVGKIFETLRQPLHPNCRARQIGHVGVTFPIGRLGLKLAQIQKKISIWIRFLEEFAMKLIKGQNILILFSSEKRETF